MSLMVRPRIICRYTAIMRVVAEPIDVPSCVGDRRFLNVFGNDDLRLDGANDPQHFWPEVDCNAASSRSGAEWLAREPTANDIDGNPICIDTFGCDASDIIVNWHMRPMLAEDASSEWIALAERDRLEAAGPLKAKRKATNPAE